MATPARGKVKWEEMFPDELLAAIRKAPVCYLAYGLAEPHGPYNALGLDWLKAHALMVRSAEAHGGVVAPPFAWHMQELPEFHGEWLPRAGVKEPLSSSIPADLFFRTALYQIRAIDARGFHAGILVTGHYGGLERTLRLLCDYYLRRTGSPLRLCAIADSECMTFEDYRGDHAGVCETSQLMALRPELVDLARTKAPAELGERFAGTTFPDANGRSPSAELGEKILRSQVQRLGEIAAELLDAYRPKAGWKAPSLNETDDIWHRFHRLTTRYWAITTYKEYMEKTGPEFPGWEALGE